MFFAALFAMYFSLRANSPQIWEHDTAILNVPFALTNTLILVASSFTAQFGVFAAERMQPRATGWSPTKWGMVEWFLLSYVMGAMFVSGQAWEYANLLVWQCLLHHHRFPRFARDRRFGRIPFGYR
jgi:cytochrome c oxidase subunit 3